MSTQRIREIDAGRGVAMFFVCLSHFCEYYLTSNGKLSMLHNIWKITMLASPTFMIISGITLGYLFSVNKNHFHEIKRKYLDRGLFLITIAHLLIMISWIPMIKEFHGNMMIVFITDTIGICLILGSILISKIRPLMRIILGSLLFFFAWSVANSHILISKYFNIVIEILCSTTKNSNFFDNFPIMQWFGFYLVGTAIGEQVGNFHLSGQQNLIRSYLMKTGIVFIGVAISLVVAMKFVRHYGLIGSVDTIQALFNFSQKNPPALIYLLSYGGIGLILLSALNFLIEYKYLLPIINLFEIVGKTSLVTFILQYFMYFTLIVWLRPPYSPLWPLLYLGTVVIIFIVVLFWHKKRLNKYLTILNLTVWKTL